MANYKQFPQQFSAEVLAGTSTGEVAEFGFRATYLRLANVGTTAQVHFSLASTEGATTGDALLPVSGTVEIQNMPPCSAVGLATASSSTSDALKRVAVLAVG